MIKFGSVCSGIEAASVAWHPLGWEAAWLSEIEKFPSQVLAHHYPNTPNLGDMTKFKEWSSDSAINVLVGGTPCQSFSVAGLRKGLDDPRGNLMLTYLAIAAKHRPKWLVWENVPGVLSSADGRDFGSFLGGLAILGYGFAYRVLDAQYFGVAQRRRRVFVVGYFGNWQRAAAVLFERHSLCGYPAPSREKGKSIAPSVTTGAPVGSLCARTGQSISVQDAEQGHLLAQPIALAENTIGRKPENGGNGDGFTENGPMYTLNATGVHGVAQPIPLNSMNCFRSPDADASTGCGIGDEGEAMYTITKMHSHAVAQPVYELHSQDSRVRELKDVCSTVSATYGAGGGNVPITFMPAMSVVAPTLTASNDPSRSPQSSEITQQVYSVLQASMAVRRLTPTECERLQGFPDGYTDIQHGGKSTPDGPRYKALGNSMAVPVMAWIGQRIQQVEEILG